MSIDWQKEEATDYDTALDLAWVIVKDFKEPLRHGFSQKLDWCLQGLLTRTMVASKKEEGFFASTVQRIACPWVGVTAEKDFDIDQWEKVAQGLQAKKIAVVLEDPKFESQIKKMSDRLGKRLEVTVYL